jgi:hypothetical protein
MSSIFTTSTSTAFSFSVIIEPNSIQVTFTQSPGFEQFRVNPVLNMKVKTANPYSIVMYHETCKYIRDSPLGLKIFEWTC